MIIVRTYWEFLFTHYTSYKEWQPTIEETENVRLYIMQPNSKHNYIAIYI